VDFCFHAAGYYSLVAEFDFLATDSYFLATEFIISVMF